MLQNSTAVTFVSIASLCCVIYLVPASMTAAVAALALFIAYLVSRNLYVTVPFVVVSVIPSDYILDLQINLPVGYLHPVIPILVLVLFCQFLASCKNKDFLVSVSLPTQIGSLFFLLLAVTLAVNDPSATGWKKWLNMLLASYGTILVLGNNPRIDYKSALNVVFSTSLVIAVIAVLEFAFGFNPYKELFATFWWDQQVGHLWRVISLLGNSLVLSTYLLLVLTAALLVPTKNLLHWLVISFNSIAILLSFSRSAIAILACILLYLVFFTLSKKEVLVTAAILILSATVVMSCIERYDLQSEVFSRFLFRDSSSVSLTHRATSWEQTFDVEDFSTVLFGLGLGNLEKELSTFSNMEFKTFDNAFLEIFWESGSLGLVALVAFLISPCIIRNNKNYRYNFALFVVFAASSCSFTTYYFASTWLTYWFLQALIFQEGRKDGRMFFSSAATANLATHHEVKVGSTRFTLE